MQFNMHQEVGALFKLVACKADGSVARETEWFHNLVLDTGLARMSVGTWINCCCVGTGNSTPVATQTALDAFVASTTTQQAKSQAVQVTTAPYYYSATVTWRFAQGVAAGNISEVGLGWGNTTLWNRALIKDSSGNPTTITVLSDEYLDVVSEVRVYPAQSLSGSFNLLDKTGAVISTHTYVGIPVMKNPSLTFSQTYLTTSTNYFVWDGALGSITSEPGGGRTGAPSLSTTYPTPTSCRTTFSLGLSEANMSHRTFWVSVAGLMSSGDVNSSSSYKAEITPTITKTSSQIMTYTFELSWGRYTS